MIRKTIDKIILLLTNEPNLKTILIIAKIWNLVLILFSISNSTITPFIFPTIILNMPFRFL